MVRPDPKTSQKTTQGELCFGCGHSRHGAAGCWDEECDCIDSPSSAACPACADEKRTPRRYGSEPCASCGPSLTIGSLFAGIGGLELGLERAGLGPVRWQVEIDPFARAVLAHHWPQATRYNDVREVGAELAPVEVICGGFPCTDISNAGKRAGIDGARSGLWAHYARIVGLVRPRFVVVENVAALLHRGMGRVLGDLASLGYDAEWDCLPASALGAPHQRDRLFLLAWHVPDAERDRGGQLAERDQRQGRGVRTTERWHAHAAHVRSALADRDERRREGEWFGGLLDGERTGGGGDAHGRGGARLRGRQDEAGELADAFGKAGGSETRQPVTGDGSSALRAGQEEPGRRRGEVADTDRIGRNEGEWRGDEAPGRPEPDDGLSAWPPGPDDLHAWGGVSPLAQPAFCRLADGLPDDLVRGRRDSLKAYGNAVVPAVAEVVGRRLMEIANAA